MMLLLVFVFFGTTCLGKEMDQHDTILTAKETNVAFANPRKILPEDRFTRTPPSLSVRPRTGSQSLEVLRYARMAQTKVQEHAHMLEHLQSSQAMRKQAGRYPSMTTTQKQPAVNHENYGQPTDLKHQLEIQYTQSDHSAEQNQETELHNRDPEQGFVKEQEQITKYIKPSQITFKEEHIVRNADLSHISEDPPLPTCTDSSYTVKTKQALDSSEDSHGETSSVVAQQQQQVFSYTESSGHKIARSPPEAGSEESGLIQSEQIIAPEEEQELNLTDVNHNIYQGQQGVKSAEVWHQQQNMNNNKSGHTVSQDQSAPNSSRSNQTMTREQSGPTYIQSSQTMAQEQPGPTYTLYSQTMTQEQPVPNYTQSSQTMTQEQPGPTYTQYSQTMTQEQPMLHCTQSSQTMTTQEQPGPTYTKYSQTLTKEQSGPNNSQSNHSEAQVQSMPNLAESSQTIARDQTIILEQPESKGAMSIRTTVDNRHPLTAAPKSPTENPRRLFDNQSMIPKSTSSLNILLYKSQHNMDIVSPGSDQTQKKLNFAFTVTNSANNSSKAHMDPLPCSVFVWRNDTIANCSFRNIRSLPVPGINDTITIFYAQGNIITTLPDNSFQNYTHLKILDLSRNKLSKLEELSFYGLKQLKLLNLSDNHLTMVNSTFPENVFSSLISLEELYLNKNNKNCKATGANYPDKALSHLTNLKKLAMDGMFDTDFGPGFQNLTSLVHLSMGGYTLGCCNMSSITNLTFQYLTQLKRLNISDCYIPGRFIHPEAFSPLQNLVSLDLSHNEDIDIQGLDKVFYSIRNITTLRELRMRLIVNRYSLGICLDHYFIRNIPQHLEIFDAQENNLEGLDRQVIRLLSPSLKTLDVSGNRFVFGTYLQDLHLMKNLTKLRLNGGGFVYRLPDRFPFQKYLPGGGPNCTLYGGAGVPPGEYLPLIVKLPPNLESIEMNGAGLTYILSNLTIDPDNKLKILSMNKNRFPWLEGTFVGLNHLEYLDVSSSYVGKISPEFFINLTSLETLKLGENLLGDFFSNEASPRVFKHLTNLKYMDLSFNDIRSLSRDVFTGLDNLEILLLKKNPFTEFDINISQMSKLSLLNLTRSKVYNLPVDVRQHIDQLVSGGKKVVIDMSQCPIYCTCQNLDFLIWIKTSGVFANESSSYLCVYDDNSSKYIKDGYNSTIEFLTRKCGSNTVLFLCVAGAMVLLFCVIICSVLYRFRWKLRYLYYAAHMFYRSAKRAKEITEFEYDAFISYDEADDRFVIGKMAYELEKRGLKLCIHGRDFRAGEYIASNIVRAVCASRRTVVVLTRHMINSYWCKYEIQMANMEAVYTGRRVLLFLLMENIPDDAMGVELLYYIRNSTYIPYPKDLPDATSIGKLWDKLVSDILD